MTNKRLDRKFMSWVWGIIRLFPLLLFFISCFSVVLQLQQQGFNDIEYFNDNFASIMFNGAFDTYFDNIISLTPTFLFDFQNEIKNYFQYTTSYLNDLFISFIFYQVWISILQILFNVLMILPNIANYFFEKFAHAGNKKGDY